MNVKQRFSVAVSTVLPALALIGYLSLSPAKVHAFTSCPDGETYTPSPSGYCQSGAGYDYPVGDNGIFVFCKTEGGQPNGPGTCESTACVKCEYGAEP